MFKRILLAAFILINCQFVIADEASDLAAASINVPLRIETGTGTGNNDGSNPPSSGGTPLLTNQLITIFERLNSPS